MSTTDGNNFYQGATSAATIGGIPGAAFIATHGLSAGLGALAGVGNIVGTFFSGIGAAQPGWSGTIAAPSAAATTNPTPHTMVATAETRPPGGSFGEVQERPANLSLFAPERGALAEQPIQPELCNTPLFACDWEAGTMRMKTIYIPMPDGTTFVQMAQGVEAAASAVWRWLRPPPNRRQSTVPGLPGVGTSTLGQKPGRRRKGD